MQYDANLFFDDGTTSLVSAGTFQDSPNALKLVNAGAHINQGLGEINFIEAEITTAVAGASITGLTVQLFLAPDSSGAPGAYDTNPIEQATFPALTVGSRVQLMLPPLPANRQWAKLRYQGIGNTTLTAGKIFATLAPAKQPAVP